MQYNKHLYKGHPTHSPKIYTRPSYSSKHFLNLPKRTNSIQRTNQLNVYAPPQVSFIWRFHCLYISTITCSLKLCLITCTQTTTIRQMISLIISHIQSNIEIILSIKKIAEKITKNGSVKNHTRKNSKLQPLGR